MLSGARPVPSCPVTSPDDIARHLGAQNLKRGEYVSLDRKLNAASRSLSRGNTTAAVNQLGAFVRELRALQRRGRIASFAAGQLTMMVEELVDFIQAGATRLPR